MFHFNELGSVKLRKKSFRNLTSVKIYLVPFHAALGGCRRPTSVTRFGEILPFWQKLKSLRRLFGGLFCVWQKIEPSLANIL